MQEVACPNALMDSFNPRSLKDLKHDEEQAVDSNDLQTLKKNCKKHYKKHEGLQEGGRHFQHMLQLHISTYLSHYRILYGIIHATQCVHNHPPPTTSDSFT